MTRVPSLCQGNFESPLLVSTQSREPHVVGPTWDSLSERRDKRRDKRQQEACIEQTLLGEDQLPAPLKALNFKPSRRDKLGFIASDLAGGAAWQERIGFDGGSCHRGADARRRGFGWRTSVAIRMRHVAFIRGSRGAGTGNICPPPGRQVTVRVAVILGMLRAVNA